MSPLRIARKQRDATLEQVCADLDAKSATGSCGITPSMLSGWERALHVTSNGYRTLLSDYYQQPAEILFAHQDQLDPPGGDSPRLLITHRDLHAAMLAVVEDAHHWLAVTGSRSRDIAYLQAIETVLADRHELVHYRILFGPPRHTLLRDHLLRLIELRDPDDRSLGIKTLHIAMIDIIDAPDIPERFFAANEHTAVVPIPSLTSSDAFDSGVMLDVGARLIDHARQLYAAGRKVETSHALRALSPS
ncbi:XRE family transcriptional regulator [Nocardia terpenica]|uniref:hypothetical protein n=1 Tax=Nocardia terpenica TaxID=455432 RepID=UPI002FDF3D63